MDVRTVKNESAETTKQKRERSVNFTEDETDLLVSIVETKKYIIENKKSDATTWQDKEKAWKDIEMKFNSYSGLVYRDHKHLKQKYEALKRDIRKKSAVYGVEGYEAGGGTHTPPVFTPAEQRLKMILHSIDGNGVSMESECVWPSTSESIISRLSAGEQNSQASLDHTLTDDSSTVPEVVVEIQEEDSEPPRKKLCDVSQQNGLLSSKPKERRPFHKLIEEKIKITKIKNRIMTEELEQRLIQRKILEKELQHKDVIHELEKQHLLLKIKLAQRDLGEK